METQSGVVSRFGPPFVELSPVILNLVPGDVLVWHMECPEDRALVAESRPPGVALVVVLPPELDPKAAAPILRRLEAARPCVVLPYHERPSIVDLRLLLTETPRDLSFRVLDLLAWRGNVVSSETKRLLAHVLDAAPHLRTVQGLARSLYMSRRALGRRLAQANVPVPSHWLHFGRLIRAALRLQRDDEPLATVAYDLGYPDAFALSNQMVRTFGLRPSETRSFLGWEGLAEIWLTREGVTPRPASPDHSER